MSAFELQVGTQTKERKQHVLTPILPVVEAAAIGIPDEIKGNEVVCFCVLIPGAESGEALINTLKERVAVELGKPLKPKAVKFVPDLPKTRNGKVMRRLIRAAFLGEPPGDSSSLLNPEAVEFIRSLK